MSYGKGAMIFARDLRKSYANVQAVNRVSLEFMWLSEKPFGFSARRGQDNDPSVLIRYSGPIAAKCLSRGCPIRCAGNHRQLGVAGQVEPFMTSWCRGEPCFFGRLYGLAEFVSRNA